MWILTKLVDVTLVYFVIDNLLQFYVLLLDLKFNLSHQTFIYRLDAGNFHINAKKRCHLSCKTLQCCHYVPGICICSSTEICVTTKKVVLSLLKF